MTPPAPRSESPWPTLLAGLLVGVVLTTAGFATLGRAPAGEAGGAARTLRLGHGLETGHPVHAACVRFAERVEALSGGRLRVDVHPNGSLGSQPEMIEQLQVGALDLCNASAAQLESFVPEVAVLGLPYVFRDRGHFWRVLDGPVGEELADAGRGVGLQGLAWFDAGSRSFYTVDQPVRGPEDLAGLKIRVMESRTAMDLVSRMGAAPTPISFGELYTALQQGMVDGAENNPPSYLANRHFEVAPFLTLDEHTRVPDVLLVAAGVLEGLTAGDRAILAGAAGEASALQRELWQTQTEEALAAVVAAGVEVLRPDPEAFAARTRPMLAGHAGTATGAMLDRIRETP